MIQAFQKKGLDSPRLMAEMLVSHVIGCERLKLYLDPERPATELERSSLRDLVGRALAHEPVQYLIGEAWFFGLEFKVDRRVLIPRPATQTIVEEVLQHARAQPGFGGAGQGRGGDGILIADICTGSGCIAISILKHLAGARAIATDISPDALAVATVNAARHGVTDRLELLEGDLLAPLESHPVASAAGSLHYLVSNPPYIPDDEWEHVAPNVKDHEPAHALRGGVDGLDFVRRLMPAGVRFLTPGGVLLVEVPDSKASIAADLCRATPELEGVRVLDDVDGLPRVVTARRIGG